MPIDFHDNRNKMTYSTRTADETWLSFMNENVNLVGKVVADIGCGGGIYTKALVDLGAKSVTGIDFSAEMLLGAEENCSGMDEAAFVQGDAFNTGMPSDVFDIILERALIHHLTDLNSCFKEANRIIKTNGVYIIQDRTPQDCLLPGDGSHIRGYFFEKYPKLAEKEVSRRYDSLKVRTELELTGFTVAKELQLWETRQIYDDFEALSQDLLLRTGRSILHELNDDELQELVYYIKGNLNNQSPIIERDSWTVWIAIKP